MAIQKAAKKMPRVPSTMKVAAIDRFGPPSVLKLRELPVPRPGPSEILIALHSAGVGVWDASVRDGSWQPGGRPQFPLIPGTDGAGIVAAKGGRVRRFRIGNRVYAFEYGNPKGGFYAEYAVAKARHAAPIPRRLDLSEAGAAAPTGLTALQGIDDTLRVRRGQTILIFGASGAVGTLAVQFAKRRQARVLATASGRRAQKLVLRLGADGVIDARRKDALKRLRKLAPAGIDAVLALAAGKALTSMLDLVRKGGRVAYPNGIEPEPRRRKAFRLLSYDAGSGPREFARLNRAAAEARLRVPVAAVYSLAQAAKAHAHLKKGHILGRIVLRIRGKR